MIWPCCVRTKTAQFYVYPGQYTNYANTSTFISKFVFVLPGSYNGKGFEWNCIHFNIILILGLLLIVNNLRTLKLSASER